MQSGETKMQPVDNILVARDLTKEFAGFLAVNSVDLDVQRGSIHALIGPNGAGKTTCFNLLTKFLLPTRGHILFNGRDITSLGPASTARMGLIRSFQISAVFGNMSVLENVRVALQRKANVGNSFLISEMRLSSLNERAEELLDWVGVLDHRHELASELPYGKKRALEIATTIALDPELMLLDEPMAGMDRAGTEATTDLIRRVARDRTILMVEHNMGVISTLADKISVLARGQIIAEGTYKEVSSNPQVIEAYLGSDHV